MTKRRTLQRNRIALLLAVILMFCAFGADGVVPEKRMLLSEQKATSGAIVCPEAGEFFAGSLPLQKQQSVRELLTDWQGNMILRPGRITESRNGCRQAQVSIGLLMSLRKTTFYIEYPVAEGGTPAASGRETIVCYIHNQDGAKG